MIERYLPAGWEAVDRHVLTYRHSILVAKAAELLANACGLDSQAAFVFGEMHDIGKFFLDPSEYYKHGLVGYDLLIDDYPEIAEICISHTFPGFFPTHVDKVCAGDNFSAARIIHILETIKNNEYIELIQLCDKLSGVNEYVSLEAKLRWYHEKRGIPEDELEKCYGQTLKKIQCKFEAKIGKNLKDVLPTT